MTNYFLKFLILVTFIFAFACNEREDDDVNLSQVCNESAIHTIDNTLGTMQFLPCYDVWAIALDEFVDEEGVKSIGTSRDLDERFRVEGMRVQLNACFVEFDLPLLLPDPTFWGYLYKMENFEVIVEE